MSLSVAVKAFFAALARKDASDRIEAALRGGDAAENALKLEDAGRKDGSGDLGGIAKLGKRRGTGGLKGGDSAKNGPDAGTQPSALALLAALQREARFVDFVKEPLDSFDDATIGAAARGPLGRCAAVLERFFEIRPLTDVAEGAEISLDGDAARNSARVRVAGSGTGGENGIAGRLAHSGWIAQKCATPLWSGNAEDAFVLAPMEIDAE